MYCYTNIRRKCNWVGGLAPNKNVSVPILNAYITCNEKWVGSRELIPPPPPFQALAMDYGSLWGRGIWGWGGVRERIEVNVNIYFIIVNHFSFTSKQN